MAMVTATEMEMTMEMVTRPGRSRYLVTISNVTDFGIVMATPSALSVSRDQVLALILYLLSQTSLAAQ